ncbi:MAG: B12-binding domain-containing radical SAM protein [Clostridia bacterium]|jgi:radical SAM superfamily enzyme YgiQ (UPF0313 family)|nr:B12-binding domain-containing radical SAM protein [Clostridia bacterium]
MKKYIREEKNERLRVCLIKASAKSGFSEYKKAMLGLPQNIFSVAACTPDDVSIQMVDETVGVKVDWNTGADIVVVMFHTPDAIRGYEIADKFREKGKTVILGGLHPSFLVEEALEHADTVIIGESEGIWEELLEDYEKGKLKRTYKRDSLLNLSELKPYPTDILPTELYEHSWTVSVSRGCPNKCAYCTVHKFFPTYRKRPIEDIVEEIKNAPTDFIELKADNLTVDRNYCLELFKALEPLNIVWMTALEAGFAEDKELVEAAAKSGLRNILLGIETPSREVLKDNNKGFLDLTKLKENIDFLHSFDIEIDSAMLFGFDGHDKDIFKETLEFALDINIDITHGVVPIPFPGTELYKKMDESGRLTTKDWSKYDGSWLVFKHDNFTVNSIYEGIMWYEEEFNKRHIKREFKWHKRWDNKDFSYEKSTEGYNLGGVGKKKNKVPKNIKWKTIMALVMIFSGIIFNINFIFGILYVLWAILDIKTGNAYVIENIEKRENPILFWLIVITWLTSGLYVLLSDLLMIM